VRIVLMMVGVGKGVGIEGESSGEWIMVNGEW
jgi:hypothetical protein